MEGNMTGVTLVRGELRPQLTSDVRKVHVS